MVCSLHKLHGAHYSHGGSSGKSLLKTTSALLLDHVLKKSKSEVGAAQAEAAVHVRVKGSLSYTGRNTGLIVPFVLVSQALTRDILRNRLDVMAAVKHQPLKEPFNKPSLAPTSALLTTFKTCLDPVLKVKLDRLFLYAQFPEPDEVILLGPDPTTSPGEEPKKPAKLGPPNSKRAMKRADRRNKKRKPLSDLDPEEAEESAALQRALSVRDEVHRMYDPLPAPGAEVMEKIEKKKVGQALYQRFGQGVSERVVEVMEDVGMVGADLELRRKIAAQLGSWVAGVLTEEKAMHALVSLAQSLIHCKPLSLTLVQNSFRQRALLGLTIPPFRSRDTLALTM